MDRFVLSRDGNDVVVHVDQMIQSDDDPTGWANAALPVTEASSGMS
jgi:hypothetical protein